MARDILSLLLGGSPTHGMVYGDSPQGPADRPRGNTGSLIPTPGPASIAANRLWSILNGADAGPPGPSGMSTLLRMLGAGGAAGAMETPLAQLLLGGVPQGGPAGAKVIYHGTPHKFAPTPRNPLGEFDLGKIGTGEGAQAYGHGIYLAENPGVARSYRTVGIPSFSHTASGKPISSGLSTKLEAAWRDAHGSTHGPSQSGIANAVAQNLERVRQSALKAQDFDLYSWAADMQSELQHVMRDYPTPKGQVLRVDLPDEHIARMLDWDAPLREQPSAVQRLTGPDLPVTPVPMSGEGVFSVGNQHYVMFDKPSGKWLSIGRLGKVHGRFGSKTEAVMDAARWASPSQPTTGASAYGFLSDLVGGNPQASGLLSQHGVPGLRYFDQGSRAQGQGTRNYVVWDPSILNIIGRE